MDGFRRAGERGVGGMREKARLGDEQVGLPQTEDVALAQSPRDQPRPAHPQLEEDVAAAAREAGSAGARVRAVLVVDHGVEPETLVVAIVLDEGAAA